MSKILVSGLQPTGAVHIGNYFGAMKQFVDLQDKYESRIFIADLHALTFIQNKETLEENTLNLVLDYLAIGLNPDKCLIFKQSDISEVAELTWIFNCLTTMPYLMRAHAFKDAEAKNKEINVGKFDYPMLMAADILMHDADTVPVGADQKQHIEIARDTAEKFNRVYGETFKLPEPLILEDVATVPGLDGQKMSKSHGNTIPLFASDVEIDKLVMSIVTDSKSPTEPKDPEKDNVFALHKLFTSGPEFDELRDRYQAGDISYKESKETLAKNMKLIVAPLRERRAKISKGNALEVLEKGKKKAHEIVEKKMRDVRVRIGLTLT